MELMFQILHHCNLLIWVIYQLLYIGFTGMYLNLHHLLFLLFMMLVKKEEVLKQMFKMDSKLLLLLTKCLNYSLI